MISVECESCDERFDVPDELAGTREHCPSCGHKCAVLIDRDRLFVSTPPEGRRQADEVASPKSAFAAPLSAFATAAVGCVSLVVAVGIYADDAAAGVVGFAAGLLELAAAEIIYYLALIAHRLR